MTRPGRSLRPRKRAGPPSAVWVGASFLSRKGGAWLHFTKSTAESLHQPADALHFTNPATIAMTNRSDREGRMRRMGLMAVSSLLGPETTGIEGTR